MSTTRWNPEVEIVVKHEEGDSGGLYYQYDGYVQCYSLLLLLL